MWTDATEFSKKLAECDEIEGFPTHYRREEILVTTDRGETRRGLIYFQDDRGRSEAKGTLSFPDGDWFCGRKHKKY